MRKNTYIVATIRPWNIKVFHSDISSYHGVWHLVSDPKKLTVAFVKKVKPRYIFFPHWSSIVPNKILELSTCVCFHETDVPFGRGGSPIQNLIVRGHTRTKISALKMDQGIDTGPVYLKRSLSLSGTAEEVFVRASKIVAKMILKIIQTNPKPKPQKGKVVLFKRRKPEQSELPQDMKSIKKLYDYIRMLDAPEYPKAFIVKDDVRYEFSHPVLKQKEIHANVKITPL